MGQFELVQNRDHKEYQVYTHYTMIQTDPNSKHPLEKPIAYNPHLLFSNLVSNLYVWRQDTAGACKAFKPLITLSLVLSRWFRGLSGLGTFPDFEVKGMAERAALTMALYTAKGGPRPLYSLDQNYFGWEDIGTMVQVKTPPLEQTPLPEGHHCPPWRTQTAVVLRQGLMLTLKYLVSLQYLLTLKYHLVTLKYHLQTLKYHL